jgi:hypothetical protein
MHGKAVKCVLALLLIGLVLIANPLAGITKPAVHAQFLSAAPPAKEWDKIFGDGNVLPATQVIQTSDGGYAIIGNSGNYHTPSVAWLVKTDAAGKMQWNQTFNYLFSVVGLVQTSDGGYTVAGSGYTEKEKGLFGSSTPWGIMLVKTNSNGKVQWSQTYKDKGSAQAMIQTNDGGYALAGSVSKGEILVNSTVHSLSDGVLIKTDPNGKIQWNKAVGEPSDNFFSSLVQTSDGGYALAGSTTFDSTKGYSDFNNLHYWLVKTNSNGDFVWSYSYRTGQNRTTYYGDSWNWELQANNKPNSIVQTDDGGYVLAGYTYVYGAGGSDAWLVKTDSSGKMVWNQTYGGYGSLTLHNAVGEPFVLYSNGSGNDFANSVIKTSDGGLAFAGTTRLSDISGFRIAWLVKLDLNGNMQWNTTYSNYEQGGRGSWGANCLIETSDGGLALAGFYEVGSSTNYYYLVKTEPTLPPPTPTPSPSSSPSAGLSPEVYLILFALSLTVILIVLVVVAVLRREKKKT